MVEKRHLSKNEQTEINFDERSTAHLGPLSHGTGYGGIYSEVDTKRGESKGVSQQITSLRGGENS